MFRAAQMSRRCMGPSFHFPHSTQRFVVVRRIAMRAAEHRVLSLYMESP
jgi:hypothetical protein